VDEKAAQLLRQSLVLQLGGPGAPQLADKVSALVAWWGEATHLVVEAVPLIAQLRAENPEEQKRALLVLFEGLKEIITTATQGGTRSLWPDIDAKATERLGTPHCAAQARRPAIATSRRP
jgi:hypothetical protein